MAETDGSIKTCSNLLSLWLTAVISTFLVNYTCPENFILLISYPKAMPPLPTLPVEANAAGEREIRIVM